jgi:hypothetical protein
MSLEIFLTVLPVPPVSMLLSYTVVPAYDIFEKVFSAFHKMLFVSEKIKLQICF